MTQSKKIMLYQGDCLDVLAKLDDASIDAVVTDPPYNLSFMGKHWDNGAVAFDTAVWGHCLRLLKPGGHLLAFGGTRTWHRLCCAIEDSGFEIRDSIAWLYGSGFPKSLDVSKAIDKAAGVEREVTGLRVYGDGHIQNDSASREVGEGGEAGQGYHYGVERLETAPTSEAAKQWQGWGTALKPSHEPIIVARKPIQSTVAANVLAHGTGALNIDACRVEGDMSTGTWGAKQDSSIGYHGTEVTGYRSQQHPTGRWPTNVVIDEHAAAGIDEQSGNRPGGKFPGNAAKSPKFTGATYNGGRVYDGMIDEPTRKMGDSGGASRYFPTFKYQAKAPRSERPNVNEISHPTVKPLELMRWLIRLVTPPGGLVLDPFAGSGTTAEAAILERMRCIMIESEPDYLPLIRQRLGRNGFGRVK